MARALPALALALLCSSSLGSSAAASVSPSAVPSGGTVSLRTLLRAGRRPLNGVSRSAPSRAARGTAAALVLPPFTDVTTPELADSSSSFGVAWGDYDQDGDADLCVANQFASSHLFRNDATTMVDDTVAPLSDLESADAMTWGDFDNDGDPDVYVAQYGAPNHLLRNDGHDVLTDVTSGALGDPGATTSAVWGDYDNDGHLDLYLTDFDGANKLLRNLGDGTFGDMTPPVLHGNGNSMSATWGDADDDGDLDLYVVNFTRANQLFRNDGQGTFVDATTVALASPTWSTAAVWADLDGDGDLDLFVVSDGDPSRVLRNDGQLTFTDITSGALAAPGVGIGVACGDVDVDGDLDLFVTRYGELNQLFVNDGTGVFEDATSPVLADSSFSTGTAFGDYDGDGDLDLFVANDGDANHLYRNDNPVGSHWLEIRLQGTQSNRSGIGARVKLVAGGVTRVRELSGGSGFGSQDALMAAFGLGATSTIDSLIVRWPSGIVQWMIPAPGVDQVLNVTETPMALAVGGAPAGVARLRLSPASPNPFRASTRIAYDLPRSSHVELSVLDTQGRRIATLAEGAEDAGHHSALWSGRDAAGHEVRTGCYLVRLTATGSHGDETQVAKLMLTR